MPRGGARPGAGRKRKRPLLHPRPERESVCAACGQRFSLKARGGIRKWCFECLPDVESIGKSAHTARWKELTGYTEKHNAARRRIFFICKCGRLRLEPFSTKNQSRCDHCRLFSDLKRRAKDRERGRRRDRALAQDPAHKERKRREQRLRAERARALRPPPELPSPCADWPSLRLSSCRWCDLPYWHMGARSFCSDQCRNDSINYSTRVSHGNISFPALRTNLCWTCRREPVEVRNSLCSHCDRERRRQRKHKQRMRDRGLRAGLYTLSQIAARDNFLCGICGNPVNMTAECPDPYSPTRDHIVPISRGGQDTPENVQLAHFECNWRKGDSPPQDPQ